MTATSLMTPGGRMVNPMTWTEPQITITPEIRELLARIDALKSGITPVQQLSPEEREVWARECAAQAVARGTRIDAGTAVRSGVVTKPMSLMVTADMFPPEPEKDPNVCWLCNGDKRVEFSMGDSEDEPATQGVYDPCPECEEVKDR